MARTAYVANAAGGANYTRRERNRWRELRTVRGISTGRQACRM
ncbi:hypothetical protein ACFU8Q_33595 [Streptomyces sp. NPDC057543]